MARKFGGTLNVDLPPGKKLINITWKEDSLWYLTRDRKVGETVDTYQFKEDSNLGVMEGTVTIIEH